MSIRFRVRNFRALREVDLELDEVSCVVGANGSGKTTLLFALEFAWAALRTGVKSARAAFGGFSLHNRDIGPREPVEIELSSRGFAWRLKVEAVGGTVTALSEEFFEGDQRVMWREGGYLHHRSGQKVRASGDKGSLDYVNVLDDDDDARVLAWVLSLLEGAAHYDPDLFGLRVNGSKASSTTELETRCENAFTMLRWWNERRPERARFDFVVEGMRAALPNLVEELDFDVAGESVFLRVYPPGAKNPEPISAASNGLLSLLCTLTALAAASPGGVVAVDEPENGLHPFAIRRLVEHARPWCVSRGITALFTTHSPVLLNQFRSEPERIVVFEGGEALGPRALDQIRSREWLANLLPGDLYEHGEFGAPVTGGG